ncbi:ribonuclease HI [Streptomyces sp. NPDC101213]|uniref:ribonuclease HI n=1 Tax=Streptomyces sp. NPDC101213 TaxID=3366130 RepID=UPI0037F1E2ED
MTWKVNVTITPHTELVRHYAEDFTALQDAALARMNGMASPETAAALAHPSLAEPLAVALAHADVLARGDIRRAELSGVSAPHRLRRLREHARRVRRARSEADAVCKEQRARRVAGRRRPPLEPLELRVARAADPEAYGRALREVLIDHGSPAADVPAPDDDLALWAWQRGPAAAEPPAAVRELLECHDDAFVQVLLRDAREEENPHLAHDAVVERWGRHARTALAWGRYAIARAERQVLARPLTARRVQLDALDDAYQDAAILAARAREARHRIADLHDRIRDRAADGPLAELVARCRAAALLRLSADEPELWQRACRLATEHRADCDARADGCPRCHRTLAARLAEDVSAATSQDHDGDDGPEGLAPDYPDYKERYAILDDSPSRAAVAVADAAVGDESALCGYGWAAEDGTTGYGDSMASCSGEAEVIGICQAALSLLDRHPEAPVVVLCDSTEAVGAVNLALTNAGPAAARRTVLFPEGRELLERLVPHRHRLQIRWLKGHIGHDLNETADALAGLAVRRVTGRVAASAARRQEARILRSATSGRPPVLVAA